MTARIEPHAEPIPGYRLIERLGVGGFGEVWKCEAPGGLYKAIKIVHGELGDADSITDEDSRADQELKALKRVKTVHHPYILSLERFDIVEGQLMIVMELADRTLWDRFKECRSQGLPGIPRQELLGYMRETAEALDLMNDQFQLQHLDIKPQNLFLVFNHVKVADFGLVKDLGTKATATITGGVTPVYAAPETFDGWLSRFSDQYSLAIVFQELLTGQRPFGGATMRQLVLQHLQGEPDLTPLPAADRSIVARALSKDPERRYPNCLELIERLQSATRTGGADQQVGAPAPAPDESDISSGPHTQDARGKGLGPRRAQDDPDDGACRPQVLPPRPDHYYTPVTADTAAPADDLPLSQGVGRSTVPAVRRAGSAVEAMTAESGQIQPSLVIGLGGCGVRTLTQLRRRLTREVARPDELPSVRLLGVDTDPETLQAAGSGEPGHALVNSEVLPVRLRRASHYLKSGSGWSGTNGWLNPKLLYRIPRDQTSAGLRPLGRLALADHIRSFLRRLETELQACTTPTSAPPAQGALAPRSLTPRVYLVACLAGNTGSGMFTDVAYAARDVLRRLAQPNAEIVGVFLVPAPEATTRPTALANAHAALAELTHFSRHPYRARYDSGDPQTKPVVIQDESAPFSRCVLFTLPRPSGAGSEDATAQTLARVGDYLYRDIATPLGKAADDTRLRALREAGANAGPGPHFLCPNVNRLSWPRQALLEQSARRMCRRLVERWMSKDARPIAEELAQWADEKWDSLGLRPEALIARLHELCEKQLKQSPDRLMTAVTDPLREALTPTPGKPDAAPALGPAVTVLAELDALMGIAEECRAANQPSPPVGTLESTLADVSRGLAESCEQRLAEQVVKLIEDPRYRLAGAEEALRRLSAVVERSLQAQETLGHELNERAAQLYQRIQKLLETPAAPSTTTNASAWRLTFSRRTPAKRIDPATELLELLRQYPKARYHALVLGHLNRLYVGLRGQLSDQLREVGFCRQRLGELVTLLQPAVADGDDATPQGRALLPTGCQTLDDALAQVEQGLTRDDLLALDQQMQALIRQQYRALVHVCMGSSAMVRTLAPAMLARARAFLEPRFGGTSVADLLLRRDATDDSQRDGHAAAELQELYQRAEPKPALARPDAQIALAVVPDDPRGLELQQLVRDGLSDVNVLATDRLDEIVFYREHIFRAASAADLLGAAAREAYRQRLAADPISLHTREDIAQWQPLAAAAR